MNRLSRLWTGDSQSHQGLSAEEDVAPEIIDLAIAENWLMRPELLSILRSVSASDFIEKDLSYLNIFTGRFELTDALVIFFNDFFLPSRRVERNHVVVTAGASNALDVLLSAICSPGEAVLVPAPFWNGFQVHFSLRAQVVIIPVHVACIEDVFVTEELLAALEIAVKTSSATIKALVLTNPHNPLGQCYGIDTLESCAKFCELHDIQLIFDEVYALSTFHSSSGGIRNEFISALQLNLEYLDCAPSRIHVLWSTSKDFCASGLRLGCVVSQNNESLIHFIAMRSSIQVSALSSVYLTSLLSSPLLPALISLNKQRLRESYVALTSFFSSFGINYIEASAGLFVFAQLAPWARNDEDEDRFLVRLKDFGVLISLGRDYNIPGNMKGWYRVTHAVRPSNLAVAIARMERCLC